MKMKSIGLACFLSAVALFAGCANSERKKSDAMWTSIAGSQDDPNRKAKDSEMERTGHSNPDDADREEYARKFKADTDRF